MGLQDSKVYQRKSSERLRRIMKKKVQTTMIGAISSLENIFGFLWEDDSEDSQQMRELFDKFRSEVLDKGNHQIRNVDTELDMYDIVLTRNSITLPVRPAGGQ
jgi:hypothetical protein